MTHLEFARKQFGLGVAPRPKAPARLPLPDEGRVLAVIGPSGAGKTRALAALAKRSGATLCQPLTRQQLRRRVLDLFSARLESTGVLRVLAQCGLSDATLWTRRAGTLSAGERRRLELALVISEGAREVILDEFDAHLDAQTALCLAASLAALARRLRLRLVVSMHRLEVLGALAPQRVLELERGQARELPVPPPLDPLAGLVVERGSLADFAAFAHWHYLGARRPGPVSDVFVAKLGQRVIAVATFGPTHLFLSPRNEALPQFSSCLVASDGATALNANVRLLQRVIVEPRFRALGVASRLLREALPQLGVPFVECLAEMGQFSGFLERAGFERRGRCKASREVARLERTLARWGINARALAHAPKRAATLAALPPRRRLTLLRQLRAVCRSRIETGVGRMRKAPRLCETVLSRALLRLHCRPDYFLWSRDGTD